MGRPSSGLKRHIQAHCHSTEKTPISVRNRPGVKIYIQAGVGGRKNDAMTLKEMNRMKKNRSAESSIRTPHGTLSPAMAMAMPAHQMKHRIHALKPLK